MDAHNVPLAPRKEDEDVWKYPRPPALQRTPKFVALSPVTDIQPLANRMGGYRWR